MDVDPTTPKPTMAPWAFVLGVSDLTRTASYFRDVLGFRISWDEADDWRLAQRDGVRIMLGHCPDDTPPRDLGSHNLFGYVEVNDIEALHDEIVDRGAISTAPVNMPYGMREIVVTTVDGHRVIFAQQIR
jgi:predicted enzyme related to lactoylglutathione lyase